MKKIGLLATALLVNAVVFAQSAESKNQHGVAVRTTAKSETTVGANKGEDVSSTASVNSHSSISAAKTHKQKDNEERKEAAAERRAEAKAELQGTLEAKKEAIAERKENTQSAVDSKKEALAERRAEAKANADARIESSLNTTHEVSSEVGARAKSSLNRARSARAEGNINSATKAQLRRPSVAGSVGAAARLHL